MNTNKLDFEYCTVFSAGIPSSPAVIFDDEMDEDEIMIEEPIDHNLIKLKFWEPYPKKPVMVDFHHDGVIDAVSDKIGSILTSMKIKGIQLIPATIFDPKNKHTYEDYCYLHIYNYLECLDRNKSIYQPDRVGGVASIDKLALDERKLSRIPLEERLIFRLGEMYTQQLFHKTVVDKIMENNPQGIRFVNVKDFKEGSAFD
jgi:hypothetical protein